MLGDSHQARAGVVPPEARLEQQKRNRFPTLFGGRGGDKRKPTKYKITFYADEILKLVTEQAETNLVICKGNAEAAARVPRWSALHYYSMIDLHQKEARAKLQALKNK